MSYEVREWKHSRLLFVGQNEIGRLCRCVSRAAIVLSPNLKTCTADPVGFLVE